MPDLQHKAALTCKEGCGYTRLPCACVCVCVCVGCVCGGGGARLDYSYDTYQISEAAQAGSKFKTSGATKKRKAVVKINSTTELRTDVYIPTNSGVPTKTFGLEFLLRSRAAPKSMIFSCSPLVTLHHNVLRLGRGGGRKRAVL